MTLLKLDAETLSVYLHEDRVGTIRIRGEYAAFFFDPEYRRSPDRGVLGLAFEEDLSKVWTGQGRLPSWFRNALPEGRLREYLNVALGDERAATGMQSEIHLFEAIGGDLPGAVRVERSQGSDSSEFGPGDDAEEPPQGLSGFRFSVPGVGLKFSMRADGQQFVVPSHGAAGDWIVKFPDNLLEDLPLNEFAIMSLAGASGIELPEIKLISRGDVSGLPEFVWGDEDLGYAIARFDRAADGRVHAEDFAQVRGFHPEDKYTGTLETIAAIAYRQADEKSLAQAVRRIAFNFLIAPQELVIYISRQTPANPFASLRSRLDRAVPRPRLPGRPRD